MPRDDSILYSGLHSASFAKQTETRKEARRERDHVRKELKPAGQIVLAEIAKELNILRDRKTIKVTGVSDADLRAELIGRERAEARIEALAIRLSNLLRESD